MSAGSAAVATQGAASWRERWLMRWDQWLSSPDRKSVV